MGVTKVLKILDGREHQALTKGSGVINWCKKEIKVQIAYQITRKNLKRQIQLV
jgi:hypothetical protein